MGLIIVVDDIRLSADKRAVHCGNTDTAIQLFEESLSRGEEIDQLWLDYDMSETRGIGWRTTIPLAHWLIENQQSRTPLVIHQIFVHSRHNHAKNLIGLLTPYFAVSGGTLPDSMWWEQPTEDETRGQA